MLSRVGLSSESCTVRTVRARAAALSTVLSLGAASLLWAQDTSAVARANAARDSVERVAVPVGEVTRRELRDVLANASRRNVLPPDLIAYKARVETEIAVLLRREEGTEAVTAVEQVASALRWTRTGYYDQHVIGYRAQQVGANFSMLSIFQTGWLNPSLYGNRLRVVRRQSPGASAREARAGAATDSARPASVRRDGLDTLPAIHPLAADRDAYYRYTGGDTIVTMRTGDRSIPIVHVRVQPRDDVTAQVLLFDGELDLDASRGALVRMRGNFVRLNAKRSPLGAALVDAVAFIEYENAERLGEYWLPARQRLELQATAPFLGDGRAVIRIVSRFAQMDVNDTTLSAASLAAADSTRRLARRRLSFASTDSLSGYGEWRSAIGDLTTGMHADDFNDIGPDRWRTTGAPRFDYTVPRASDAFHFNRVEGVYTGVGIKLSLRDLAPGVVVRANAGWAWNEGTARGRVIVERTRGPVTIELRGGRSLDNTNDFRVPLDSGNSFGALLGSVDPYDYVDRRSATLAVVATLGKRAVNVRGEVGVADDRYRPASYVRSPFGGAAYRPNRGVDQGGYLRSAALVEWHPDINAEFMRPGLGARLFYERGDGTLAFQRVEARVVGRRPFGPFVAVMRGDVGALIGDTPPAQQLFELGRQQNLPGYLDKEFAGTRAAVLRGQLQYNTNYLRQPLRIGRLFLPAIAPALSVGVQSGWTELPNAAARASVVRLGVVRDSSGALLPVARATDGIRASVTAGVRLFGGGFFLGATRQVDQPSPWRALLTFGQQW